MVLLLSLTAFASASAPSFQIDRAASARYEAGKEQLDRLIQDPADQGCWAGAVEQLKAGCKAMDDDQRSRLAVQVRVRTSAHMHHE